LKRSEKVFFKLLSNRVDAKNNHYEFIKYCWLRPDPFIEAKEVPFQRIICERIDRAIQDYRKGKSTYLLIKTHPRAGKSQIVSRALPPHFLGEFPDSEIMELSCESSLAMDLSKDARFLISSPQYQELYPDIRLSGESQAVDSWAIHGHLGKTEWSGILGGYVGKGASLLIIDDYCKNREDAESPAIRNKTWASFANDAITRVAPVHIVIVMATPWHVDDLIGRIEKTMLENPKFPQFDILSFPAESDTYPSKYLFPERFSPDFYEMQRATKGLYAYSSLYLCNPIVRGENVIRTDKVNICDIRTLPQNLCFVRGYDLASSKLEIIKSDPDYTVGVKAAVDWRETAIPGVKMPRIHIVDALRGRWSAPTRNNIIRDTALAESGVRVGIEAFGAYKDAFTTLEDVLMGLRKVEKSQLPGSKTAKAEKIVPVFEAGNVFIYHSGFEDGKETNRPQWIDDMMDELDVAPFGAHDDIMDALCVAFDIAKTMSDDIVHVKESIVSDDILENADQVFTGVTVYEANCYMCTVQYDSTGKKIHVVHEEIIDTVDDICAYLKSVKKGRAIGSKDLNSDSNQSLLNEILKRKLSIEITDDIDKLGTLYFLNGMIDKGNFTVDSNCDKLLLAIQNSSDIKNISPFLMSLLYIINNIYVSVKRIEREPAKPFSRESAKYQAEQTALLTRGKVKQELSPGW
jgi:phage terminase large subunit-like protein